MFFPLDACRFFPTKIFPFFVVKTLSTRACWSRHKVRSSPWRCTSWTIWDSSQGISHLGEITILLDFFFNRHFQYFHIFLIVSSSAKRHKDVFGFCWHHRLTSLQTIANTLKTGMFDMNSSWWYWYCWWLKSCTTWNVQNPINKRINYQPQLVNVGFLNHQQ